MKTAKLQCNPQWRQSLADYVTAVAWSPNADCLVAATAAGEVVRFSPQGEAMALQANTGQAVSCLGVSADGIYLAWSGQSGTVMICSLSQAHIISKHAYSSVWIDTLAWHPTLPLLAYGVGSVVRVVDTETGKTVAQLDFETSSVLHLAWQPTGDRLAVSGHGGVKVWLVADWDTPPKLIAVPGASLDCAWSVDGRYLGSGNLDRTLTVADWDSPPPWLMQGFPGKVRQLAWSTVPTPSGSPLVAAACVEGVTVWERNAQAKAGWQSQVLQHHQQRVNAIAFQPQTLMLATAGQDGRIALWRDGRKLEQSLKAFAAGVSCLAWSPTGDRIWAGGTAGEVQLWQVTRRAQGFG